MTVFHFESDSVKPISCMRIKVIVIIILIIMIIIIIMRRLGFEPCLILYMRILLNEETVLELISITVP